MVSIHQMNKFKRRKRKWYLVYPVFLIPIWLWDNQILDLILISLFVLFLFAHQAYFYRVQTKMESVDVSF